jgi:hypothetical protein
LGCSSRLGAASSGYAEETLTRFFTPEKGCRFQRRNAWRHGPDAAFALALERSDDVFLVNNAGDLQRVDRGGRLRP